MTRTPLSHSNHWFLLALTALLAYGLLTMDHAAAEPPANSQPRWTADEQLVNELSEKRPQINYDEAKVPDYTLPDSLKLQNGTDVVDAATWHDVRRQELMSLFRNHVYGHRPETEYTINFAQQSEQPVFDGKAIGRSIEATIEIGDRRFSFPFMLFIPAEIQQPVPAVVFINNRYFTPVAKLDAEADPFFPVQDLIDRGYAAASFHTSDVDPDRKDGYDEGIRSFFAAGEERTAGDWGSLSAWGFAASRVLDHLQSVPQIDASRVAVVGHSRGGKTALWAAAEDPRFAIAYSNQSGCGGAALSRRRYGETVGVITTNFPHWFCQNFAQYSGQEEQLPVDQHQLLALIAPRGAYVASADKDLWADPKGEYLSLIHAAPVYSLLGKDSLGKAILQHPSPLVDVRPAPLDQSEVVGPTGYHIVSGGHGLDPAAWNMFLDFADGLGK